MTFEKACSIAAKRSKKLSCDIYVVCEGENQWDIATDYDMDTYHNGSSVQAHYCCGDVISDGY